MKSKHDIIIETVEYYQKNKRGMLETPMLQCVYYDEEGDITCAIGRCMKNPKTFETIYSAVNHLFKDESELDEVLKEEYKGHDLKFWTSLQIFHDNDNNWVTKEDGGNELTEQGLKKVTELMETYAEGVY
jgi:hypothetical protein